MDAPAEIALLRGLLANVAAKLGGAEVAALEAAVDRLGRLTASAGLASGGGGGADGASAPPSMVEPTRNAPVDLTVSLPPPAVTF